MKLTCIEVSGQAIPRSRFDQQAVLFGPPFLAARFDAVGAVREDVYQDGAITRQVWHNSPDALSSDVAREEVERVLRIARTEQLELKL